MGLSLTADVVGWVLVDVDAGGLLDHDVLEVTAGAETAGAAVLGAHAIAATAGHEIDRVRITWSDDAAHDGLRLQSRLRSLALSPVEAVPQSRALAVLVDPEDADLPVDIVLAYGAAMAAAVSLVGNPPFVAWSHGLSATATAVTKNARKARGWLRTWEQRLDAARVHRVDRAPQRRGAAGQRPHELELVAVVHTHVGVAAPEHGRLDPAERLSETVQPAVHGAAHAAASW